MAKPCVVVWSWSRVGRREGYYTRELLPGTVRKEVMDSSAGVLHDNPPYHEVGYLFCVVVVVVRDDVVFSQSVVVASVF